MKKEISPLIAGIIVLVLVAVVAGVYLVAGNHEEKAKPMSNKPITLPPSQVGTKLGGRTLGNDGPSAPSPGR